LLKLEDFERMSDTHPQIKIVLLRNLRLGPVPEAAQANRELIVFDY